MNRISKDANDSEYINPFEMETIGTKENHTHIKFYYKAGHKMTLNKSTLKHYYPGEENNPEVERIEYLIKPV